MSFGLGDVSFRHVDSRRRQPWPHLLDEIEKTSRPAAHVEKSKAALIASGEKLLQRGQRLSSGRIGGPLKEDLDLDIVSLRGVLCHPAARLKVEILQVIIGPLALRLRVQDLAIAAALAPMMNYRQV